MSSRPKRCAAWRTKAAASASRSTCASTKTTSPPLAAISAATRLPRSASRSAKATFAPSFTNRRTVASPIPEAPPVTAATFPFSRAMVGTYTAGGRRDKGKLSLGRLVVVCREWNPKGGADMAAKMVLSEDEALELLAFLVTAARTQVDEAAEYGSLRLLTAAGRLAEFITERVSPETGEFLRGPLKQIPDLALRSVDPAKYSTELDAVCQAVGEHLVNHFGGGAR